MNPLSQISRSQTVKNENITKARFPPAKTTQRNGKPLQNITNLKRTNVGLKKKVAETGQQTKTTAAVATTRSLKRSAAALEQSSEEQSLYLNAAEPASQRGATTTRSMTAAHLNKRRKSDCMEIDEAVEQHQTWEDIDAEDDDDPQMVSDYVNDIYMYLREKEQKEAVSPRYMQTQVDINEKMRAILVDWLIEVHRMFKLLPETLFLTVNIIDRYLELKPVTRTLLQLVGVTSMLIASKYEEIYAPECNDFVFIADGAYTKDQILDMEESILSALSFNLSPPITLHFLRRFSKAADSDYTTHTLCKYITEMTMIDLKLLKYLPSQIAAASVYLARCMTHKFPIWTPTLEHYTTYSASEARTIAIEVNDLLKRAQRSSLKAIKKKYSSDKYFQVASLPLINDL